MCCAQLVAHVSRLEGDLRLMYHKHKADEDGITNAGCVAFAKDYGLLDKKGVDRDPVPQGLCDQDLDAVDDNGAERQHPLPGG